MWPTDFANLTADLADPPTGIPHRVGADYFEIVYLTILVAFGLPLNGVVMKQSFQMLVKSRRDDAKSSFLLLKIHVNVSDYLILLVHGFVKALWLANYQWPAGSQLCKVYKMASMFSFYANSNIVVCIGLDRLGTVVLHPHKIRRRSDVNRVKLMLFFAWLVAGLFSLPQYLFFDTIDLDPNHVIYPNGWYQCTDIWEISERLNITAAFNTQVSVYHDLCHLITVFWLPFVILLVCYGLISIKLMQYANGRQQPKRRKYGSAGLITRQPYWNRQLRRNQPPSGETLLSERGQATGGGTAASSSNHTTAAVAPPSPDATGDHIRPCPVPVPVSGPARFKRSNNGAIVRQGSAPTQRRGRSALSKSALARTIQGPFKYGGSFKVKSRKATVTIAEEAQVLDSGTGHKWQRGPTWRRQISSKAFRSTLLVVVVHLTLWLPYCGFALIKYVDMRAYQQLDRHGRMLNDLILLNPLINPFLYGSRK